MSIIIRPFSITFSFVGDEPISTSQIFYNNYSKTNTALLLDSFLVLFLCKVGSRFFVLLQNSNLDSTMRNNWRVNLIKNKIRICSNAEVSEQTGNENLSYDSVKLNIWLKPFFNSSWAQTNFCRNFLYRLYNILKIANHLKSKQLNVSIIVVTSLTMKLWRASFTSTSGLSLVTLSPYWSLTY